jgi:hypothetical protein
MNIISAPASIKRDVMIPRIGELRSLIHSALEYLSHYAEPPVRTLDFNAGFGATDTLLDIEEALHSFKTLEWPDDLGQSYLLTFGTLQALIIQQDAVESLCGVFSVPFNKHSSPNLRHVRICESGLRVIQRDMALGKAQVPQRFSCARNLRANARLR